MPLHLLGKPGRVRHAGAKPASQSNPSSTILSEYADRRKSQPYRIDKRVGSQSFSPRLYEWLVAEGLATDYSGSSVGCRYEWGRG